MGSSRPICLGVCVCVHISRVGVWLFLFIFIWSHIFFEREREHASLVSRSLIYSGLCTSGVMRPLVITGLISIRDLVIDWLLVCCLGMKRLGMEICF